MLSFYYCISGLQIGVKNLYLLLHGHVDVKNYPWLMQIDEAESKAKPSFPSDKPVPHLSASVSGHLPNSIAALNSITTHQQQ